MNYQKTQKISAKAIFERDSKILLVKDSKGVWELPGGRIEHGEEPTQTLLRELNEELGWSKVSVQKIVQAWSFTSKIGDCHYHFIILVYSCSTREKEVRENAEYSEYSWIPLDELDELDMREGYKEAIRKYFAENEHD